MRDDRDVTVIEAGSGSGLKWFLLGAAVGAGLGLLLAPQSGERTRRDLVRRGRTLRARAEETFEDFSEEVQTRGRNLKEKAEEFADGVIDEVKDEVKGGKRKIARNASNAREEMERRLADARARARAAVGADDVAEADEEADDEPA